MLNGLRNIREGIVSGSWLLVCDGYNSISGEDLKPYKKISRLDNIREMLHQPTIESTEVEVNANTNTNTNTNIDDEGLPIIGATKEYRQKGGERFGKGEITIISSDKIPNEAEENARNSRPRRVVKRNTELKPISGKGGVGFNPSNEPRVAGYLDIPSDESDDE